VTQSFIPQFDSNSPILGAWSIDHVNAELARTPLSCLDGCTVDHVADALTGQPRKTCLAVTAVTKIEPSWYAPAWLIRGTARTEGTYRTAEVGILRQGESADKAVCFDPEQARELAALLLSAAREAEELARTAVPVEL
jgi:hypothetical protein